MDPQFKRFGWLANSVVVVIMSAAALAQSQAADAKPASNSGEAQSTTVLKATTRLVVVDVVATDGKGVPITGLTAKDFVLTENGKVQEVRVFSFSGPGKEPENLAAPAQPEPKIPGNVVSNIPEYKPNSALNILLLDSLNTTSNNQSVVRRQMVKVLDKLPGDRPVAIYMLSQKLQLLQDFTTDPAILRNVVANLKSTNSPLLENPTGGAPQQYLSPIASQTLTEMSPAALDKIIGFVNSSIDNQNEQRVHITLEALNALARTLSGYSGRKNLIWISEEFPIIIDLETRNFGNYVSRTAEALASAQVAVYTIDPRGSAASSTFKPEAPSTDRYGRSRRGRELSRDISAEDGDQIDSHSTMNHVADITGGRAFYNANDFDKAVRQSVDDGSTYYTLGYYPSNKQWNGQFRKIKVKVERPDLHLRYRLGYFALDPTSYSIKDAAQRAQDFGQTLNLNNPVSTALLFRAAIFPPSEKTHNQVALNYYLDAHQIFFEKQADGLQHASLDYAVQVYNLKGDPIKAEASSVTAALQPDIFDKVMQTGFPYQLRFDLPAGNYTLRLGVRDNRTGLMGSVTGKLAISAQEATQKSQ